MVKDNPSSFALQAQILLDRLERISADSAWAHQASGIRASLARKLAEPNLVYQDLKELMGVGFNILENAAGEIPEDRS